MSVSAVLVRIPRILMEAADRERATAPRPGKWNSDLLTIIDMHAYEGKQLKQNKIYTFFFSLEKKP